MRPSSPNSPLTHTFCVPKMDLFHTLMELIDKNTENISEGDYLQMCDTMKKLRERVKPPAFLLDQNQPLWVSEETTATTEVPTHDRDFYDRPYESTLPVTVTPNLRRAMEMPGSRARNWEGVRPRGNTDEMNDMDLALVAMAVAHETYLAEANYVMQHGHS